jgi:4-hydroxybenzoate polyprenyltransferase
MQGLQAALHNFLCVLVGFCTFFRAVGGKMWWIGMGMIPGIAMMDWMYRMESFALCWRST